MEILCNNQKCFLLSLYRSPTQNIDEFENFIKNFELLLDALFNSNPYLILILGDFNAKSNSWCEDDHDSLEGTKIETVTSSFGLTQLISDPTHILPSSSSCIDLIFTNQPNLVNKSGVYSALHINCHHQITFAEIDFRLFFPPPYDRRIWHYNRCDIEGIRRSIDILDWERLFSNKNVNQQVVTFNSTLMNILSNFIPNEVITINDKDPPWISNFIKQKISQKNELFKIYQKNGNKSADFDKVQSICLEISNSIYNSK